MIRKVTLVMAVTALIVSAVPVFAWSGSLDTGTGGLVYGGGWEPVTLSWDVTAAGPGVYRYEYTLEIGASGDISHMILELTDDEFYNDFTYPSIDMFNLQWYQGGAWVDWNPELEVKEHASGGGNPDMPTNLFGVKYDDLGDDTYLRWRFDAARMPVWGDFYSKDGGSPGAEKYVYNEGFSRPDPLDAPSDGTIDNHVLRPDGRTPELPPSALMGLGMLPLGIAYLRGSRRKRD